VEANRTSDAQITEEAEVTTVMFDEDDDDDNEDDNDVSPTLLFPSDFKLENKGCGGETMDDATHSVVGEVKQQNLMMPRLQNIYGRNIA
jgi:hypothetical protein